MPENAFGDRLVAHDADTRDSVRVFNHFDVGRLVDLSAFNFDPRGFQCRDFCKFAMFTVTWVMPMAHPRWSENLEKSLIPPLPKFNSGRQSFGKHSDVVM